MGDEALRYVLSANRLRYNDEYEQNAECFFLKVI